MDEASFKLPSQNFRSSVLTPMKDLMEFRSRHMASTARVQAKKKAQMTNVTQMKGLKKLLEQMTVGASAA